MNRYISLIAFVLGVGCLVGSHWMGRHYERAIIRAKVAEASEIFKNKRGKVNEGYKDISAYDLCVDLDGLLDDCSELRGVGKNNP